MMIKPEPPYTIVEVNELFLTEIGGQVRYYIEPDVIFYLLPNTNRLWRIVTYPRNASAEERAQIRHRRPFNIITNDDAQTQINNLTEEGFYQLKNTSLPKSRVNSLQNNGYVLRINQVTYTPLIDRTVIS